MQSLSRVGSPDIECKSVLPQVYIAFSHDGKTLNGDNHDEILLKNQEIYLNEKGRLGLVPTILNKISDRGFQLNGQIVSYFSAKE